VNARGGGARRGEAMRQSVRGLLALVAACSARSYCPRRTPRSSPILAARGPTVPAPEVLLVRLAYRDGAAATAPSPSLPSALEINRDAMPGRVLRRRRQTRLDAAVLQQAGRPYAANDAQRASNSGHRDRGLPLPFDGTPPSRDRDRVTHGRMMRVQRNWRQPCWSCGVGTGLDRPSGSKCQRTAQRML
jgi:hypothetical protein